ncbi:hypothetical protein, partial [Streptomyces rimosus]|uniref:hypothetical protein n=1 Tax=Streptomyces rimosus TaxID=1927 RepID=UPI001F1FBBE1
MALLHSAGSEPDITARQESAVHAFSYCATRGVRGPRPGRLVASLFVVLLVLVGGSSGGGNAAASVSTGDPVAPYDGADGADGA